MSESLLPLVLRHDVDLTRFNTLGLPARARYFVAIEQASQLEGLPGLIQSLGRDVPVWVLGGGSNVVLRSDLPGLVIHPAMRGVYVVAQEADEVWVDVAAGEPWHDWTQTALAQGWYGLENLSLIPGSVGAAPVQNIGAYGVEVGDYIDSVQVFDGATQSWNVIPQASCEFGYRDSLFKRRSAQLATLSSHSNDGPITVPWIISSVRFRLRLKPQVRLAYAELQRELAHAGIDDPSPTQVAQAVIAIRKRKLPDPAVLGNAGSFFKNPIVPAAQARALQAQNPSLPVYELADAQAGLDGLATTCKLAAGWLIEQAGFKGWRQGSAGVHRDHALVLVNEGGATGSELMAVAQAVQAGVAQRFGVQLEAEPMVWPR